MVRKSSAGNSTNRQITADVIVLGCSLSGIVTAHNLLKKFGNSMDIMVLDFRDINKRKSKCNVAFRSCESEDESDEEILENSSTAKLASVRKRYLLKCLNEFNIPIPEAINEPKKNKSSLPKLFEHVDGSTVSCHDDYHNFTYLNVLEQFELNQYQRLLDFQMRNLFFVNTSGNEQNLLQYYDRTSMEEHLRSCLLFSTSRDIMRVTVNLACGANANSVSVLFYLHTLFRANGPKNIVDGDNTRFREKLLGYCRKRLAHQLEKSIECITMRTTPITQIGSFSDEQVILKTMQGETDYVCNLLAMAMSPDQLHDISVEDRLLVKPEVFQAAKHMSPGTAKKLFVQYTDNFWRRNGYSGDILSVRGPIFWAMERPKLSTTGSDEKYATLIGFLKVTGDSIEKSKEAVLEQLVKLFGDEAANPVSYRETEVDDVFVPRFGDYVALKSMSGIGAFERLVWGTLDVFGEGDVAAALEAGHLTYLQMVQLLRPQAQTYEDIAVTEDPHVLPQSCFSKYWCQVNCRSTLKYIVTTVAVYCAIKYIAPIFRKS